MLRRLRRDDRGDTIVEVMIVLAVLGLAIGISYATANKSLLNARQAQENSVANQRAQSQIEALNRLSSSTTQNIFQSGPYCIVPTGLPLDPYAISTSSCTTGGTVPYTTAITYDTVGDTFTVQVTWPDVMGQGSDTVTTTYRVHRP